MALVIFELFNPTSSQSPRGYPSLTLHWQVGRCSFFLFCMLVCLCGNISLLGNCMWSQGTWITKTVESLSKASYENWCILLGLLLGSPESWLKWFLGVYWVQRSIYGIFHLELNDSTKGLKSENEYKVYYRVIKHICTHTHTLWLICLHEEITGILGQTWLRTLLPQSHSSPDSLPYYSPTSLLSSLFISFAFSLEHCLFD